MNWKSFLFGVSIGAAATVLINETTRKSTLVSADKVLQHVKGAFKRDGKVDGSWINMKAEDYNMLNYKTKVYRGGLSRREGETLEQLEFIADAYTGSLLDIYSI